MNFIVWNINKIIFKDFLSYHEQAIREQDYHLARQDLEETFGHIDFLVSVFPGSKNRHFDHKE